MLCNIPMVGEVVRILAVSKGQPTYKIRKLYKLGQRDFGENYAEELASKQDELKQDCPDISWHFIGQIQSNKTKLIAKAHWVDSLASVKHAELLAQYTPHDYLRVLIQVNLNSEKNRGGVFLPDLEALSQAVSFIPRLKLEGLMAILPLHTMHLPAHWFALMQSLKKPEWPELSMGMSADFKEAILHGATWVRLGTALFRDKME